MNQDYLDNLNKKKKIIEFFNLLSEKGEPLKCHVARTLESSLVPHRNNPFGISTSVTAAR
jgi:hypothetical protein